MTSNGEEFLLRQVAKSSPNVPIIFDVGANEGQWSLCALGVCPEATIHAFEINPVVAKTLEGGFLRVLNVRTHAFGLSDVSGTVPVRITPDNDTRSTLITGAEVDSTESRISDLPVVRGDSYLSTNSIDHIDLLKIDTEGAEHLVLSGFQLALKNQQIECIQFEYGRANAVARFLLSDFYSEVVPEIRTGC